MKLFVALVLSGGAPPSATAVARPALVDAGVVAQARVATVPDAGVVALLDAGSPRPGPAMALAVDAGVAPSRGARCDYVGHVTVERTEAATEPVVVTLEVVPGSPEIEPAAGPARKPVSLFQRNFEFVPSWLVVKVGDSVSFVNEDADFHSVFASSTWPIEMPPSRRSVTGTRTLPVVALEHIQCNIHSKMRAEIFVLATSYYGLADARGNWRINAPSGKWKVVALERNGGRVEAVVSGCDSPIELKLTQAPKPIFLRKDRSSYPEYNW